MKFTPPNKWKVSSIQNKSIIDRLSKLPRWSKSCRCERPEKITYIHHGDWDEIIEFCEKCGGVVD